MKLLLINMLLLTAKGLNIYSKPKTMNAIVTAPFYSTERENIYASTMKQN